MFQFLCSLPRGDLPIGPFEPKAAKQIAEIEAELEAAEVGGFGVTCGNGDLVLLGSIGVALHSWQLGLMTWGELVILGCSG